MADESYNFTTARTRLEEIVTQVRKKDTSLEKSLDLLEEGVRLANACTELIDRADWAAAGSDTEPGATGADSEMAEPAESGDTGGGTVSDAAETGASDEASLGEAGSATADHDEEPDSPSDPTGADEFGEADPANGEDDPVGEDRALEYDLAPDEDPAEER